MRYEVLILILTTTGNTRTFVYEIINILAFVLLIFKTLIPLWTYYNIIIPKIL